MTLKVWRYPIAEVYIAGTATSPDGTVRPVRWAWWPQEYVDYFPSDVPLEAMFTFGASDYDIDIGDDEMYCPCGATLSAATTLGERAEDARQHVREAHPETLRRSGCR